MGNAAIESVKIFPDQQDRKTARGLRGIPDCKVILTIDLVKERRQTLIANALGKSFVVNVCRVLLASCVQPQYCFCVSFPSRPPSLYYGRPPSGHRLPVGK